MEHTKEKIAELIAKSSEVLPEKISSMDANDVADIYLQILQLLVNEDEEISFNGMQRDFKEQSETIQRNLSVISRLNLIEKIDLSDPERVDRLYNYLITEHHQ
jgi:Fe2+ or Zn2+ uptake regulation protein